VSVKAVSIRVSTQVVISLVISVSTQVVISLVILQIFLYLAKLCQPGLVQQ
jgi:hypothetical protein